MFIAAQVFGVLCLLAYILSTQTNARKNVLFFKAFSDLFAAFQYLLLSATSGFVINIIAVLRDILLFTLGERKILGFKSRTLVAVFTSFLIVVFSIIFYDTWASVLVGISSFITTVFLCVPDLTEYRVTQLLAKPLMMIYNIIFGAYVGLIVDIVQASSLIVGIERFDKAKIRRRVRKARREARKQARKLARKARKTSRRALGSSQKTLGSSRKTLGGKKSRKAQKRTSKKR